MLPVFGIGRKEAARSSKAGGRTEETSRTSNSGRKSGSSSRPSDPGRRSEKSSRTLDTSRRTEKPSRTEKQLDRATYEKCCNCNKENAVKDLKTGFRCFWCRKHALKCLCEKREAYKYTICDNCEHESPHANGKGRCLTLVKRRKCCSCHNLYSMKIKECPYDGHTLVGRNGESCCITPLCTPNEGWRRCCRCGAWNILTNKTCGNPFCHEGGQHRMQDRGSPKECQIGTLWRICCACNSANSTQSRYCVGGKTECLHDMLGGCCKVIILCRRWKCNLDECGVWNYMKDKSCHSCGKDIPGPGQGHSTDVETFMVPIKVTTSKLLTSPEDPTTTSRSSKPRHSSRSEHSSNGGRSSKSGHRTKSGRSSTSGHSSGLEHPQLSKYSTPSSNQGGKHILTAEALKSFSPLPDVLWLETDENLIFRTKMKLGFKQDIELRHFTFVSVAERRSHINLTRRLESKREPAPAPASKPESETKSGFEGESQYHSKLENIPEVESKSESALVSYQEPEPRESLPGSQPADLLDSQANDQTHEATLPTETLEPVPAPQEVVYSNPLQAEPQSLPPEVTISLQRAPEPAPIGPQQPSPAQIEESTTASSEGCSVSSTESPESSEVPQLRTTVAQEDCSGLERSTIPEASQPSLPPATVDEEASLTHAPPPVVEEPELPAAKVEESNVSATEQAESPEIPPAATDRSGSHDPANSGEPNNTHLDSCPGQNVSQEDRVTEPETEATGASDGDSGASISGEDDNPIPENTVEATDERDEDDKPTPEHSVATSYERDDDEFSQSLTRSSSLASSRSSSSASSQGHSQAEIVKVTEGH